MIMSSSSSFSPSPSPSLRTFSLLLFLIAILPSTHSLTCTSQTHTLSKNTLYKTCLDLPDLDSYLHYTYNASNSSVSIAFLSTPPKSTGWVSWALNPTSMGMVGSQALIAFKDSNGKMVVKTYNVSAYGPVKESKIAYDVWDLEGEEVSGVMVIYANLRLLAGEDVSKLNQVWQVGGSVTDGVPDAHEMKPANFGSKGALNLLSGEGGTSSTSGDSRLKKKNIHGVLNVVSWGIMFPIGIIIARYIRTFQSADPAWFYLHVLCQVSAYAIGVAGWGTGMKLGSESAGIVYSSHRNIGIALFALATVQIFALFLRPKKDHKLRFYWNIYHHGIGYVILVLGILNVFKGLDILQPEDKWKKAYIIVIAAIGGVAVLLELITWIVVLKRRSSKSTKPYDGYNGQGRDQPLSI